MKDLRGSRAGIAVAASLAASLPLVATAAKAQDPAPVRAANGQAGEQTPPLQARPDIETQHTQAQQQAQSTVDRDAAAVITETRAALEAIEKNDKAAALAALERATGKANILLARNPAAAFIPTDAEVQLIETAPADLATISTATDAVSVAINRKDYPLARVLLDSLRSEIRIRSYSLPLATYPAALLEAARLLEAGQTDEAGAALRAALTTIVIVDRSIPLPLIEATSAIASAEAARTRDKPAALAHLAVGRDALRRAQALGYIETSSATGLETAIAGLERQLRGAGDSTAAFGKLRSDLGDLSRTRNAAQSEGRSRR